MQTQPTPTGNETADGGTYILLNAVTAALTSVTAFAAATHALSAPPSIAELFKAAGIGVAVMLAPRILPYIPPARAAIRRTALRTAGLCLAGGLVAGWVMANIPVKQDKQIAQIAAGTPAQPVVYRPAAP